MDTLPAAFVRPLNPDNDLAALIAVFRETCDDTLKTEPTWTLGSYVWCRPYPILSPSNCFVLDDGNGKPVGYILGTPNTDEFVQRWREDYLPRITDELDSLPPVDNSAGKDVEEIKRERNDWTNIIRNDPESEIFAEFRGELKAYPGHLHIDILPSHQGKGFGKQLIKRFLSTMKDEGCTGVYLGMVASNIGAAKFYETLGFKRLPHTLDGGESGELGRTKVEEGRQALYYVIDL